MAIERYNAAEAEARWQKIWDERGIFATPNRDLGKKYYVLEMFPYPSGRIHMGHVRNYKMGDVVARVKRAMGFAVLHPMGWDASGPPAAAAAKNNTKLAAFIEECRHHSTAQADSDTAEKMGFDTGIKAVHPFD